MLGINIPENQIGNWKIEMDNGECSLVKISMNIYYERLSARIRHTSVALG